MNRQCPNCGAFATENSQFCTNCGNRFAEPQPVEQPVYAEQQTVAQPVYAEPQQPAYTEPQAAYNQQPAYTEPQPAYTQQPTYTEPQPAYTQQPVNQYGNVYNQYQQAPAVVPQSVPVIAKIFSIVGFASGILSLVLCWYFYAGLIIAAIGLVFSIISKNKIGTANAGVFSRFSKIGLILSIIGLALGAISTIVWIALLAAASAL